MSFYSAVKRWVNMIFAGKAQVEFDVKGITSQTMRRFIDRCANIYQGNPFWLEDNVRTVNFAKTICEEASRLATLNIEVKVDGSSRAEWLQKQMDEILDNLRDWVEYGCAYGTVVLKPNGDTVDLVLPDKFMVTDERNGRINGMVFVNQASSANRKVFYTRLEYHRFVDGIYVVTNKCYSGATPEDISTTIAIEQSPWIGMEEEVMIRNLDNPLFAVLKMPGANPIDANDPLGIPIFSDAIEELKDLDVAYSRNSEEIYDSQRTVLMDADMLLPRKGSTTSSQVQESIRKQMKLPKYVRNVTSSSDKEFYQEINPTLNTQERINGINSYLSQIGFKCGFSNGYFVFDEKTGMITATQVESDDRRTLQTIKDIRKVVQVCIEDLASALASFADLYDLSPVGTYELSFFFEDLTQNIEEDRARWLQLANMGIIPKWKYLEKFEGFTEDEAKAIVAEVDGKDGLFEE